ncbi:MAG: helix-turn-helix domain-containing protein [candidate division NC10 bacterium]|nr:helix-turn-helix domain-containing protein [candidate division NC10 bacterium]
MKMQGENLIGPKDVAALLAVPVSWVYAQAEAGRLPSFKIGKYRRFDPQAIREWLEQQRGGVNGR